MSLIYVYDIDSDRWYGHRNSTAELHADNHKGSMLLLPEMFHPFAPSFVRLYQPHPMTLAFKSLSTAAMISTAELLSLAYTY